MDQLIPGLAALVEPFRDCFHPQVFQTFQALIAGWIVCLGPRTISEVWQATGLAAKRHHDTAYAVFHSAAWEWDDLGIVLATLILTHLIPGGVVWVVVDDTLCHKRGAKVAFGGIFLDAVLSSKRHKTFRFGLNWVVLGIAVPIPLRPDRYFCLPVLWRLYRKKGQAGLPDPPPGRRDAGAEAGRGQPRADLLAGRRQRLRQRGGVAGPAGEPPGDRAVALEGGAVRAARPASAEAEGGVAQEGGPPAQPQGDDRGHRDVPRRARDDRLPEAGRGSCGCRSIRDVLWYRGSKTEPVMVVLVRDPLGQWRDEALVATDPTASAAFVILGYCRRWSVELAFFDSKQFLGLHDPRVWSERSVERAHPMAWFVGSLTILWYCLKGHEGSHVVQGPPVVHDEGHADVHGHARCAAVADVGVRDLWRVR